MDPIAMGNNDLSGGEQYSSPKVAWRATLKSYFI